MPMYNILNLFMDIDPFNILDLYSKLCGLKDNKYPIQNEYTPEILLQRVSIDTLYTDWNSITTDDYIRKSMFCFRDAFKST